MKRLAVILLVLMLLVIFGCRRAEPANPYKGQILGTWILKPGVFGQRGELYLALLDMKSNKITLIYKDEKGRSLQGAISPDGVNLLLNRWDSDQDSLNMYTRNLKTGLETRLSEALGEETEFAWFPDSRRFVYRFGSHTNPDAGGLLFLYDTLTGQKKGIGCFEQDQDPYFCGPPAVSPDGRWVAYAKGLQREWNRRGIAVYDPPDVTRRRVTKPYSYKNALYRYDVQTETEELLVTGDGAKSLGRVVWTPDGRGLVYVLEWEDAWWNYATDLVYLDLETRQTRVLVAAGREHYANYYPVFTLDGRHLIFLSAPQLEREMEFADYSLCQYDMQTGRIEPLQVEYEGQQVRLNNMSLVR